MILWGFLDQENNAPFLEVTSGRLLEKHDQFSAGGNSGLALCVRASSSGHRPGPGPIPSLTPILHSQALLLPVLAQLKPWTVAFGATEKVKKHPPGSLSLGVWDRARMARTGEKVTNELRELKYISFPF